MNLHPQVDWAGKTNPATFTSHGIIGRPASDHQPITSSGPWDGDDG